MEREQVAPYDRDLTLANPEAVFTDLGGDYFLKKNPERERRRAIRKLEALGFTVTLTPVVAAAPA